MSNITLDDIKAEHAKVAALIQQFEAQSELLATTTQIILEGATIDLAPGECYAGPILKEDGSISHHVILLAGQADGVTWEQAEAWANEKGGQLPTRREQALLFANAKGKFEAAWYWSGEKHSAGAAWDQYFGYGCQGYDSTSFAGRARAVRRLSA